MLSKAIRSVVQLEKALIELPLDLDMNVYQDELHKCIFSGVNSRFAEFMADDRQGWVEHRESDLIDLLAKAQVCKVSDTRDRIFAFVGFADPGYEIVAN